MYFCIQAVYVYGVLFRVYPFPVYVNFTYTKNGNTLTALVTQVCRSLWRVDVIKTLIADKTCKPKITSTRVLSFVLEWYVTMHMLQYMERYSPLPYTLWVVCNTLRMQYQGISYSYCGGCVTAYWLKADVRLVCNSDYTVIYTVYE